MNSPPTPWRLDRLPHLHHVNIVFGQSHFQFRLHLEIVHLLQLTSLSSTQNLQISLPINCHNRCSSGDVFDKSGLESLDSFFSDTFLDISSLTLIFRIYQPEEDAFVRILSSINNTSFALQAFPCISQHKSRQFTVIAQRDMSDSDMSPTTLRLVSP